MFTFLQRLGRLFVVTTTLTAAGVILGVTSFSGILVSSRHGAGSGGSCTVSSPGVGQAFGVNGHGFAPNSQYALFVTTPVGKGETTANTDGTGAFAYTSYASWKGTYSATVWTMGGGAKQVAACAPVIL